jgi:hypothetical protein
MNMQTLYEKSENRAVALAFALFILVHAGLLYLFGLI